MSQLGQLFQPHFLQRLESLRLAARKPTWGNRAGGAFTINKRGTSLEFADFTEYTWSDDFRNIDWNLYGRLEKLFVKTYKEEVELNVYLLVDATASMGLPKEDKKFAFVRDLATALAYVGLSNHNIVRIAAYGGRTRRGRGDERLLQTSSASSRDGIFAQRHFLDELQPLGEIDFAKWVERYCYAVRAFGGTAIVLSDWMMDQEQWTRGLNFLRFRNLEVKVIQVLSRWELEPQRMLGHGLVVDAETGRAMSLRTGHFGQAQLTAAVQEHNERLRHFCHANHLGFAQASTQSSVEDFVLRELLKLGLLDR